MAPSYATRSEADAYFDDRNISAWTTASEQDRDAALIRASGYIDRKYAGRWKGTRGLVDQDLAWPRTGVIDADGYPIGATVLPLAIKTATFEAALAILRGVDLEPHPGMAPVIKRIAKGVGPLKKDIEYADGAGPGAVSRFEVIDALVAPLLRDKAGMTSFLMRA